MTLGSWFSHQLSLFYFSLFNPSLSLLLISIQSLLRFSMMTQSESTEASLIQIFACWRFLRRQRSQRGHPKAIAKLLRPPRGDDGARWPDLSHRDELSLSLSLSLSHHDLQVVGFCKIVVNGSGARGGFKSSVAAFSFFFFFFFFFLSGGDFVDLGFGLVFFLMYYAWFGFVTWFGVVLAVLCLVVICRW